MCIYAKVRGPQFNPEWLLVFCSSLKIFPSLSSPVDPERDSHDTYRVILRIVKAGCHPVAIAQVVEH